MLHLEIYYFLRKEYFSLIPLIKNRFSPLDSVPLTTLRFEISRLHKQMTLQNSCIIMQQILQSYPFLMSRNFKTQVCQWYRVKRIKSIFADNGNEKRFRAPWNLFIRSSNYHFFNKTNLEQNLFNPSPKKKAITIDHAIFTVNPYSIDQNKINSFNMLHHACFITKTKKQNHI